MYTNIIRICNFLGAKTIFWYFLSTLAAFMIAFIELGIASFLQLFLVTLGVISSNAKISGFLSGIHLTPTEIAVFLLVIGVFKGISQFIVGQGGVVTNESVKARLQLLNFFEMLQRENLAFVSSALVNYRTSEVFPKSAQFCAKSSQLFAMIVQCAGLAILLVLTSWKEAFFGLIGLGLIASLVYFINLEVERHSRKTPKEQAALMAGISRITRNWMFIRLKRTEKREYDNLSNSTLNYAMHSMRSSFWTQFGSAITPILGIALIVGIIMFSFQHSDNIGLTFISFLYLFVRFVQNLGALAALFGEVTSLVPQFKEALAYFSKFSRSEVITATQRVSSISAFGKEKSIKTQISNNIPKAVLNNGNSINTPEISVSDIYFGYNGQAIFEGFNCKIKAGSIFGIAGRSGSGKSTLLALILGMIEPNKGYITINNLSPKEYFKSKHSKVGYVGAEPFLIEGSIRENILYGWENYAFSDEDIKEALRKARLLDVIEKFKECFEYKLNENGEGLSAGQKQRLCIARALLGKPEVLILDEASANLDDKTEAEIAKTLLELKNQATIIIVSHRIGLLKITDDKLVLDDSMT